MNANTALGAYWDQGLVLAWWVFGIIGLAGLIIAITGLVKLRRAAAKKRDAAAGMLVIGAIVVIVAVLAIVVAWFPWSAQYNRWVPVSGKVTATGSRFISDGNHSVNQRFVVTFAGGVQRSCDDSRCSVVKPGGTLTVVCQRDFQFNAPAEGWNCNFVSYTAPGKLTAGQPG